MSAQIIEKIDALFGERQTTLAKDLKLNIRRLLVLEAAAAARPSKEKTP